MEILFFIGLIVVVFIISIVLIVSHIIDTNRLKFPRKNKKQ